MSATLSPPAEFSDPRNVVLSLGTQAGRQDLAASYWETYAAALAATSRASQRDTDSTFSSTIADGYASTVEAMESNAEEIDRLLRWKPSVPRRSSLIGRPSSKNKPRVTRLVNGRTIVVPNGYDKLRLTPRQEQLLRRARLRSAQPGARARSYVRFQLLRQWEGEVLELGDTYFRGAVVTLERDGSTRREHMRFPRRLVREQDLGVLEEGAFFFYCVGRFINPGEVTPGSILWFRRFLDYRSDIEKTMTAPEETSQVAWTS